MLGSNNGVKSSKGMRKRHRESSDDEEEEEELSLGSSRHRLTDNNHMQTIDVDGPPSLFSRTSNIGSSTPSKMQVQQH